MNKFKFGDKVLCNWGNRIFDAVVIAHWVDSDTQGQESNWLEVVDENGDKTDVGIDCVELIPHPGTIRLNALKEKILKLSDVSFTCNLCGEDNEISAEIQDIIDFAITEEQADD